MKQKTNLRLIPSPLMTTGPFVLPGFYARITEIGDFRITETGDLRIVGGLSVFVLSFNRITEQTDTRTTEAGDVRVEA